MPGMPPGMDPANFDPSKYMQAMSGMFQNPQFMQMAEKLGQAIIQVRVQQKGLQDTHISKKTQSCAVLTCLDVQVRVQRWLLNLCVCPQCGLGRGGVHALDGGAANNVVRFCGNST
jgi:hypothetical protein